ncbi:Inner membrane amino-acid ABC transporter permease protein YhdY [Halomicronema hongdechloris C2206]|uniref:Inner membrane amino-acid ABC transporter permease protein YhdY n=1 Tax=Halomicronema hongdechloris C2206 TaxID=1641165 RepID=A0A1Z3HQ46_9CYAN|nr:amino acid ABC transporter permease [Halomicronema hongdechloris]ASC72429.1 Inner membrane amino-acid ABC transporter permease protein YhdY [Halomicronema hongdechloris C2206]
MTATSPSLSPATIRHSPVAWLRKNLFNSWFNSMLTLVLGGILLWVAYSLVNWAFTMAQWQVLSANLPLYFVGRYPSDQYWRLWTALALITLASGLSWGLFSRHLSVLFSRGVLMGLGGITVLIVLVPMPGPYRARMIGLILLCTLAAWAGRLWAQRVTSLGRWLSLAWLLSFFVTLWLMAGGLGLPAVSTNNWGGLLLTLCISVVSIALSFPFGVLLALGRQSSLPIIRWLSIIYIELIRGVPLISILFMGQVMIPLFLPEGMRPDRVLRAIVGMTLFTAAYLAENVRGGLQAVPRGQIEAARSMGLNAPLTLGLIVLPQALKIAIPAIVGQFISLFQDTTLVSIVGLLELLGISRSILANPEFLGRYGEVYLFIAAIYWCFCYAMSLGSRKIEEALNTDT